jgi:hypothetical protein
VTEKENMKELFRDILSIDDVKGVMLFSFKGELVFKEFLLPLSEEPETREWWPLFIDSLQGVREADIVYENSRLYIRKTDLGYLLILMGLFAPVAMMRLNCDILLPSLEKMGATKGLVHFFKKKR